MELKAISKRYGTNRVLEDLSLTFSLGITCLMGPSGRGKTTLLRLILGLEKPDEGTITHAPARFAAVFQEDRLLENQTAMGNLRFILGPAFDRQRAEDLLARLGLEDPAGKPVREYSGGMKRRLALARALLAPGDGVILDEPFTGLDEENRAKAIACIREETLGKTVILVTHDPGDAEKLGASVLTL